MITQADKAAASGGSFDDLLESAPDSLPASVRADLERAAHGAQQAYRDVADVLRAELLPNAPEADAVRPRASTRCTRGRSSAP